MNRNNFTIHFSSSAKGAITRAGDYAHEYIGTIISDADENQALGWLKAYVIDLRGALEQYYELVDVMEDHSSTAEHCLEELIPHGSLDLNSAIGNAVGFKAIEQNVLIIEQIHIERVNLDREKLIGSIVKSVIHHLGMAVGVAFTMPWVVENNLNLTDQMQPDLREIGFVGVQDSGVMALVLSAQKDSSNSDARQMRVFKDGEAGAQESLFF